MKTRAEIETVLKEILTNQLNVREEHLVPSASFLDDLGCDSLDIVETFMAVEGEFGIRVSEEDAEKTHTYGELVDLVDRIVNPPA